jgi:hypothetical protein
MNKDSVATVVGGAAGLEQLYEAIDLLGQTGPTWAVGAAVLKAVLLIALGYLAYKPHQTQQGN